MNETNYSDISEGAMILDCGNVAYTLLSRNPGEAIIERKKVCRQPEPQSG
jgi:hypothetical protein